MEPAINSGKARTKKRFTIKFIAAPDVELRICQVRFEKRHQCEWCAKTWVGPPIPSGDRGFAYILIETLEFDAE
jgi:hypothetical protein